MIILRIGLLAIVFSSAAPAFADWMALALDPDSGSWGITVRQATKKKAEAQALKLCRGAAKKKCEIGASNDSLGYVALAVSPQFLYVFTGDTPDEAKKRALQGCADKTSTEHVCEIKYEGINGVVRDEPRAQQQNCRPRTREIRCRSNCVNGDCIVEYENGCKIRVQVPARFDPFSNQWTYPAPSC